MKVDIPALFPGASPFLQALENSLHQKERTVVGIDGRCGAGKSTFADLLCRNYGAALIHTDHFFLPPALRTAERMQTPGANVHYERFLEEVGQGLAQGGTFRYRRFDCSRMEYAGWIEIPASHLIVAEGAYTLREDLRSLFDLTVFLSVSPAEQRRRLLAREGAERFARFEQCWIPLEEQYIAASQVSETADFCFGI